MKFNLREFITKEAMGSPWQRYRNDVKWCKLEDAIQGDAIAIKNADGTQENWAQLQERVEGLKGALVETLNAKAIKIQTFLERYEATREQIEQMNMFFIQFHPMYGIYYLSIGPYVAGTQSWNKVLEFSRSKGSAKVTQDIVSEALNSPERDLSMAARSVNGDINNKFSFFTRRFAMADEATIKKSATKFLTTKIKDLSKVASLSGANIKDLLDFSDLAMVVKETKNEKGNVNLKKLDKLFNSLDPQAPDGIKLYERHPVLGTDSQISFNSKGLAKIMVAAAETGNWGDLLEKAIVSTAQEMGKTVEEARAFMYQDANFLNKIMEMASKERDALVSSGKIRAEDMPQIPNTKDIEYIVKTGNVTSQYPTELRATDTIKHMAELKVEILQTIKDLKTNDPEKIANELTLRRAKTYKGVKAKGKITPEFIGNFLRTLKFERAIFDKNGRYTGQKKAFEQTLAEAVETDQFFKNIKGNKIDEGFGSLKKCMEVAAMHFYSTGASADADSDAEADGGISSDLKVQDVALLVDPKTKAKIGFLASPAPNIFNWNGTSDFTTEELNTWRASSTGLTGGDQATMKEIKRKAMTPDALRTDILSRMQKQPTRVEQEVEEREIEEEEVLPNDGGVVVEETAEEQAEEFPVDDVTDVTEEDVLEPEVILPEQGAEDAPTKEPFSIQDVTDVEPQTVPQETEQAGNFPVEDLTVQNPAQPKAEEDFWAKWNPKKKTEKKRGIRPQIVNNPTEDTVASSLKSLIKIARELDGQGKYAAAEEVHKVIRKYHKRVK
jgi:hypothetical protein